MRARDNGTRRNEPNTASFLCVRSQMSDVVARARQYLLVGAMVRR